VTDDGAEYDIGEPMLIELHAARPDGDFSDVTLSATAEIDITRIEPSAFIARGTTLRIEGRFKGAKGTCDIAALLPDGRVVRGYFDDGTAAGSIDPEEFVIAVPTRDVSDPILTVQIVGIDRTGRAALFLPPIAVVPEPPQRLLGVRSMASTATGAARYEAFHDSTDRIDRRYVCVVGYAYDPERRVAGGGIAVRCRARDFPLDVPRTFWGAYGLAPNLFGDVPPAGVPERCGFSVTIDRSCLEAGMYDVDVLLASADLLGTFQPITLPPLAVDIDIAADGAYLKKRREKEAERD
jgi:hypothetical protein